MIEAFENSNEADILDTSNYENSLKLIPKQLIINIGLIIEKFSQLAELFKNE